MQTVVKTPLKDVKAVLAAMTKQHVLDGLNDLCRGVGPNPNPGHKLYYVTSIDGVEYGARTLVAYAALHGPKPYKLGKLYLRNSTDKMCRSALECLGFGFIKKK